MGEAVAMNKPPKDKLNRPDFFQLLLDVSAARCPTSAITMERVEWMPA
jgi:hypothetical protein